MHMQVLRGGGGVGPTPSQHGARRWVVSNTLWLIHPGKEPVPTV